MRYTPLPPDTIRLLNITSIIDGHITLELTTSTLENYNALSYTWGHPSILEESTENITVTLDGDYTISRTLYEALLKIPRHPIWVDAICINQSDPQEKTAQVTMMADIYCKADQVIIWLGNDAPETHESLQHFYNTRRYFSRAWVVQEVVLARRPVVCLDGSLIDFDSITAEKAQWLQTARQVLQGALRQHFSNWLKLMYGKEGAYFGVMFWALVSPHHDMTDWRDAIFSLHSMAVALTGKTTFEVDYTLPDPFFHFTARALMHTLDVLHFCNNESWVPNFTQGLYPLDHLCRIRWGFEPEFRAAQDDEQILNIGTNLSCLARRVGEIESVKWPEDPLTLLNLTPAAVNEGLDTVLTHTTITGIKSLFRVLFLSNPRQTTLNDDMQAYLIAYASSQSLPKISLWENDHFFSCGSLYGRTMATVRSTDELWLICCARVPFILRPRGNEYIMMGQAYVDGAMNGELIQERSDCSTIAGGPEEITILTNALITP